MDLNLEHALNLHLIGTGRKVDGPDGSPPAVPIVLWLELVVLDADHDGLPVVLPDAEGRGHAVFEVIGDVGGDLGLDGRPETFQFGIRTPRLQFRGFLSQVVVLE